MPMLTPLIEFVRRHPRLLVLTGAGCSTQAGIADYRDADGAWKRSAPMRYQLFVGDDVSRRRYWARSMVGWRTMAHARPTDAHHALVRLEGSGHVRLLVTQNVDGLHDKAGSKAVIDLHGRIDTVCCLACGQRSARGHLQQQLIGRNPSWATLDALSAPDGDADLEGLDFAQFDVPDCPACGGMLKPDVVFFGDNVPKTRVGAVTMAIDEAAGLLVIGSSLMVYSGFRFAEYAYQRGKPVMAINLGKTRADHLLAAKVEQDCGEFLGGLDLIA